MHSAQPFRNGFRENVIAVILRDVVQGLQYLHNLGYVHRLDWVYNVVNVQDPLFSLWPNCDTLGPIFIMGLLEFIWGLILCTSLWIRISFSCRSIRAKHFLIHEDGIVKLSGLRSLVSMIDGGSRMKVCPATVFSTIGQVYWNAVQYMCTCNRSQKWDHNKSLYLLHAKQVW